MHSYPIRFVDLNVTDLGRSVDFYARHLELQAIESPPGAEGEAWLDAGPAILRLREVGTGRRVSAWVPDDLQLGFRHIGFGVTDLDARVARLHAAGVPFHLEPLDATGGVRITFFFDPDGVLLELIQGTLAYHRTWNAGLAAEVAARPAPATPRFDHVAMTGRDQAATISFYRDVLGFDVSGQLFQADDPRGFEITYLHAGETVLELFTFAADTIGSPWSPDEATTGFRHVVFGEEAQGDLVGRLIGAGANAPPGGCPGLVVDRDGFPLRVARL